MVKHDVLTPLTALLREVRLLVLYLAHCITFFSSPSATVEQAATINFGGRSIAITISISEICAKTKTPYLYLSC